MNTIKSIVTYHCIKEYTTEEEEAYNFRNLNKLKLKFWFKILTPNCTATNAHFQIQCQIELKEYQRWDPWEICTYARSKSSGSGKADPKTSKPKSSTTPKVTRPHLFDPIYFRAPQIPSPNQINSQLTMEGCYLAQLLRPVVASP